MRNHVAWKQSQNKHEALLIGYFIAGDTTPSNSLQWINGSLAAGVDILELGIPSSNPYLDGEVIKRGHKRVSEQKKDADWILHYWKKLREQIAAPIWAMGYNQDVIETGLYLKLAELGLMDALVLPDCTLEEKGQIALEMNHHKVDVVQFVNSQMSEKMLADVCEHATIIYAQSYAGATGDLHASLDNLSLLYQQIRQYTEALTVVGFGLRSPDKVRIAVENHFDGTVVGSAFVAHCEKNEEDDLYHLIREMKSQTRISRNEE